MKIVFHGANAGNFRNGFAELLSSPHTIIQVGDVLERADERSAYETADVIIGNKLGAAEPKLEKLRLYHAPAAGTDGIDRARLPRGASLCNCFGHESAIAEYVMTALLLRRVPISRADERLRLGHWDYWAGRPTALRTELGRSSIGLLGYGHIGKAVGARAKAFGMRVCVANRTPVPCGVAVDETYALAQLPEFMASADAIVVSLPLMEQTRGIVGAAELAAMRPDAVIVNVGRGPVIDERALFDVLVARKIGGAVIDTWCQYPTADAAVILPSRLPFDRLDNVVMTPHMSGWTDGTIRRRQQTMASNVDRLDAGLPLENVVEATSID